MIETIVEAIRARPSMFSEYHLHHMGGAIARVGPDETSYTGRDAAFTFNVIGVWGEATDDLANQAWARDLAGSMAPYGIGRSYVNFLTERQSEQRLRDTLRPEAIPTTGGSHAPLGPHQRLPPQPEHQSGKRKLRREEFS